MSKEKLTEASTSNEVIPGYNSIEQFTKDGFKVLMEAIRHSNALPAGRDWDFYNISESFTKIVNDEGSNVLRLMNHIMRYNDIESNIRNRVLDDKTELVIEANDAILEKVAINIDEMNGVRKTVADPVLIQTVSAQLPVNGSWNRSTAATFVVNAEGKTNQETSGKKSIKLITGKNIVRPQKFFKDKIDNRNKYPWCPRITDKPNSLKPLAIFLEEHEDRQEYSHPYEFELERFAPTSDQLMEEVPKFPKNIKDTPLIEIDKAEQLDELVETLRHCNEFAVDVEHHSYRSFMGITCLLQISTKDKDYIIDTLVLRDKLWILNEVFTKNTILKIFHGSDRDVEWLQRDLSIYVVNMFDTYQAAKMLEYSSLSLAFLMRKFCNVLPNKEFQLADWRIRPLPEEFKMYAREDTHYLIYIYQMLKKELFQKANKSNKLLKAVMDNSTAICKKRYFKPILEEDSHLNLYRKCKKMFDNRQLHALKEVYAWRDNLAREEDESLAYILPNHMLLQIAENLPREMQGILACCNPIPPLVRSHLLELHQIILKARDQPLEKAILKEATTGRGVLKKISKVNVDSNLHCPHDLTKTNEFRDDLPTLLNNNDLKKENRNLFSTKLSIEKMSPFYSAFGGTESRLSKRQVFKKVHGLEYFSPYERYKLVKPYIQEEEDKKKQQENEIENQKRTEEQNENIVRTDEERIASVRDHFLQLSKKFSEELEAQKQIDDEEKRQEEQSLLQMGGSRKRKKDFDTQDYHEPMIPVNDTFTSPTPVVKTFKNNNKKKMKGKKRKFSEIDNSEFNSQDQRSDIPQQFPKKKRKNKEKFQQQNENQGYFNPASKKGFNNRNNTQNRQQTQFRGQTKQKFNRSNDQNRDFVPYDYASVDFRQFQGGAGSASGGVEIKQRFKEKKGRTMGKNGAKSATFNSFNSHRGGRDRGGHNRRGHNRGGHNRGGQDRGGYHRGGQHIGGQ